MIYLEKIVTEEKASSNNQNEIIPLFSVFSTISLVIGCLNLGIFSWLSLFSDGLFGDNLSLLSAIILICAFILLGIIGIILGLISRKKDRKTRAELGFIFNLLGFLIQLFALAIILALLTDPYINL